MPAAAATAGTALLDDWFTHVTSLRDRAALQLLADARSRIEAVEAQILARSVAADGDVRRARRLVESCGDASSIDRSRRVNRARVVAGSHAVAELWNDGKLTSEHVDRLGRADRTTEGAASVDPDLLHNLATVSADGARKTVNDWLRAHHDQDDMAERHARQRAARKAWRHKTECGLEAITVAGDKPSIDTAWSQILAAADAEYRKDGNRDIASHHHPRSGEQRLFDGAVGLWSGEAATGGRPVAVVAITVDLDTADVPSRAGPATGQRPRPAAGGGQGPRGGQGPPPELVGSGPITNQTALDLLAGSELWTLLQDPKGQPLWIGRSRKRPSRAQLIALICRDKGCVETGGHWRTCDVHHRVPWSSRAAGTTDIDNLILLSGSPHRRTHADGDHWDYNPQTGRFFKRPATPDELAPRRAEPGGAEAGPEGPL